MANSLAYHAGDIVLTRRDHRSRKRRALRARRDRLWWRDLLLGADCSSRTD